MYRNIETRLKTPEDVERAIEESKAWYAAHELPQPFTTGWKAADGGGLQRHADTTDHIYLPEEKRFLCSSRVEGTIKWIDPKTWVALPCWREEKDKKVIFRPIPTCRRCLKIMERYRKRAKMGNPPPTGLGKFRNLLRKAIAVNDADRYQLDLIRDLPKGPVEVVTDADGCVTYKSKRYRFDPPAPAHTPGFLVEETYQRGYWTAEEKRGYDIELKRNEAAVMKRYQAEQERKQSEKQETERINAAHSEWRSQFDMPVSYTVGWLADPQAERTYIWPIQRSEKTIDHVALLADLPGLGRQHEFLCGAAQNDYLVWIDPVTRMMQPDGCWQTNRTPVPTCPECLRLMGQFKKGNEK